MSSMQRIAKLISLSVHPITWEPALKTRTVAAIEHLEMLRTTMPDTLLDVGANKGQFSLATRVVSRKAKIIAFEPVRTEADIYERNFPPTCECRLYRVALGKEEGAAEINIGSRADNSSLLEISERQEAAYGIRHVRKERVAVKRLDDLVAPAALVGRSLLKIDVQGAEGQVLAGGQGLLRHLHYVYLEVSLVELYTGQPLANELIRTLDEQGFAIRGVYNLSSTIAFGLTQIDILFENRNKRSAF